MALPTTFDKDFTTRNQVIFKVTNLRNPEWGAERSSTNNFIWDFEANDYDVFTKFDIWSE